MDVTVVIPVGPRHLDIVQRAVSSVQAQSVPAGVVVVEDREARGPSWARNRGLAQVLTPYVVFLDADDELLPPFVERTLAVAQGDWNRYAYTHWLRDDGQAVESAVPAWCGDGGWHPISALLPAHWVRHMRGFDESMQRGGEDVEFYWRLTHGGCCGVCVPEPLMVYHISPGRRSAGWNNSMDRAYFEAEMRLKYGGIMSGCCGGQSADRIVTIGTEKREGDVLALATWGGVRSQVGAATGRVYREVGNYKPFWADPRDCEAMPAMFKQVVSAPPPPPPAEPVRVRAAGEPPTFTELARMTHGGQHLPPAPPPAFPSTPAQPAPTMAQILSQAQAAIGELSPAPEPAPAPADPPKRKRRAVAS